MSGGKRSSKQHKKPISKIVGIILAIVIAAGLVTGAVIWLRNNPASDSPQEQQDATDEVVKTAEKLKAAKNYDQAAEETSHQFEKTTNTDQKYMLALQTASAFESKRDCKAAIEWYQKANAIKPSDRASLSGLGRCYDANGEYAKAVEFYQKTIQAIDTDQIGADNDVAYYQSLLDAAKAKVQ